MDIKWEHLLEVMYKLIEMILTHKKKIVVKQIIRYQNKHLFKDVNRYSRSKWLSLMVKLGIGVNWKSI
jgi:hypothetical protein